LIVTGLVQEARIAAGPGLIVICSSSNPRQLRALLATLDSSTVSAVISFGLDPTLQPGDVVVATDVAAGGTRWQAGGPLREELITSITLKYGRIVSGGLAGVEQVVANLSSKAALRSETGAAAVDMESHIAAAYAAEAALPFEALRVISDPAHRALPSLVQSAIKLNGDTDLYWVLHCAQSADASLAGAGRHRFYSRVAIPPWLSRLSAERLTSLFRHQFSVITHLSEIWLTR
jgi:adenosylhomocysteine nucleosidase